ncbi:MAG: hypothetical protein OXB89_05860, partial [Anaerolineaceae bacterium]|nr:hypothetical protein [Anaerolineaceae bacterium]
AGDSAATQNGQETAAAPETPERETALPGALQQALLDLSVDELSPLEALTKLYDLKHQAEEESGEAAP